MILDADSCFDVAQRGVQMTTTQSLGGHQKRHCRPIRKGNWGFGSLLPDRFPGPLSLNHSVQAHLLPVVNPLKVRGGSLYIKTELQAREAQVTDGLSADGDHRGIAAPPRSRDVQGNVGSEPCTEHENQ